MMSSANVNRFRTEVIHVVQQIVQLADHRDSLFEANSIAALDMALEGLEHSIQILRGCVDGLKYRVALQVRRTQDCGKNANGKLP